MPADAVLSRVTPMGSRDRMREVDLPYATSASSDGARTRSALRRWTRVDHVAPAFCPSAWTARKQAEERQRLLTAELSHRVKNLVGVVQILVCRAPRSR